MIDWPKAQTRLGVKPDGQPGAVTYGALLAHISGRAVPLAQSLGLALSLNVPAYGVDANANRLAGFLGECCHESLGFTIFRELWGPTPAQLKYEGRADLGNTQPGDGYRYKGRGMIQITGRDMYAKVGKSLGLDLINQPQIAEQSGPAVLTALEVWKMKGLNQIADFGDWATITKRINGGTNGASARLSYINAALEVLS